jgi:hypothetical protein
MKKSLLIFIVVGTFMLSSCNAKYNNLPTSQTNERHMITLKTDFGFCLDYVIEVYSVSKSSLDGVRLTQGKDNGFIINRSASYHQDLSVFTQDGLIQLIEENSKIVTVGEYYSKTVNGIERISLNAICIIKGDTVVLQYTFFNFENFTYFVVIVIDGNDFSLIDPYKEIIDTIRPIA